MLRKTAAVMIVSFSLFQLGCATTDQSHRRSDLRMIGADFMHARSAFSR